VIFDNTKLKRFVPGYTATIGFERGAREIIDFYTEHPEFEPMDPALDALMDQLSERFQLG
jgi:hypothetical protein